ncbi:transcription termination/antitermination protein NusG [Zavarzinella formosa]|uniref:transcription termination/antitermination protein NusG n=1 Tax=Zavarzinella formosa TaxID=360055 RepID=UPI00035D9AFA|nr:transcription termination/antitermination NusG family protein [Zavarzinella formosa]
MSDEFPTSEPADMPEAVEPAETPVAPKAVAPIPEAAPIPAMPAAEAAGVVDAAATANKKKWYVVKVQSGREDSIKKALDRGVKIGNLEQYISNILVPVEKITEVRDGKRRIKKMKKFPGYLFVECEYNEHTLYLFRETNGVGDFVGATLVRAPLPMSDREVQRMLADQEEFIGGDTKGPASSEEATTGTRVKLDFDLGDAVKVREGMFANMEGPVKDITDRDSQTPKVKVVLTIWGRPVEVDLEYWQVDRV